MCAEGKSKYLKRLKRHNHTPLHTHSRNTPTHNFTLEQKMNQMVFFRFVKMIFIFLFPFLQPSILYTSNSQPVVLIPIVVRQKKPLSCNINKAFLDFRVPTVTLNWKIKHSSWNTKQNSWEPLLLHQWLLATLCSSFQQFLFFKLNHFDRFFQVQLDPDLHIF